jgi:hypothetical protein
MIIIFFIFCFFGRFLLEPERSLGHLQRERGQYHAGKHFVVVVVAFYEAFKLMHREDRVLSFFSSRPNWDFPTPLTRLQASVCPPPFGSGGGGTLACGRGGWGSPNSEEGTATMLLYCRLGIYVIC